MSDHLRLHDDGDEQVTRTLRELYAAPGNDAYWRGLEGRILARLSETPNIAWWDELDRWMRPALAAAAVMLLAASLALFRSHQNDQEAAYEAMLTPTTLPVETAVRPVLQGQREATFRFLMTSSR